MERFRAGAGPVHTAGHPVVPLCQVERLLAAWTAAQVLPPPAAKAAGKGAAEPLLSAVAIDGKVLRGS